VFTKRVIVCDFSFYYIKWRHLVNLLPLDNAILKLKHNGLLTSILTCAASYDLNPVDYAVMGSASGDGLPLQTFRVSAGLKSAMLSQRGNNCHKRFLTDVSVNGGVALKT